MRLSLPPRMTETSSAPRSIQDRARSYALVFGLAWFWLLFDQLSKAWVRRAIPFESYIGPESIDLLPGRFHFVHVGNYGAAWGMFEGFGGFFVVLAVLAVGAIVVFRRQLEMHRPFIQLVFGLIVGGIIGNVIDRVWQGYVTDFILVIIPVVEYHWPVFNIADAGIVVGVSSYLVDSFRPVHKAQVGENN